MTILGISFGGIEDVVNECDRMTEQCTLMYF